MIGVMGQVHTLSDGTTNLAWAAARIADHETPVRAQSL